MPHKFKVGDIVRVNAEGRREGAYGHGWLEVYELCDPWFREMGDNPTIKVRIKGTLYGARWREQWYELVEDSGPW